MTKKKVKWFEVSENETIDACLKRMEREGYTVVAKKEEPIFENLNGEIVPYRQMVKFKGALK